MRDENIVHARLGKLELRLGSPVPQSTVANVSPQPEPRTPPPAALAPTPDDDERDALATLLHSSGADVDAFMLMQRKARPLEPA